MPTSYLSFYKVIFSESFDAVATMSEIIWDLARFFKIWILEVNVECHRKSCTICLPQIRQNPGMTDFLSSLAVLMSVEIAAYICSSGYV